MTVFVDTSAIYAGLDRDDLNHEKAKACWATLVGEGTALLSNNYVLLETTALLQNRLGVAAVRTLHEEFLPMLEVVWISEHEHRTGVAAVLAAGRKKLSLVDCVSFETMRARGVRTVFCFDAHFAEQGFKVLP
ncbi:MAG: PIN domain-containing protein [Bryobacteraceae bacterium]|jgi:predicted nucleic acid-binding protein